MSLTYGTPLTGTLSETVTTTMERLFVQGDKGDVVGTFKKYAQVETKTEKYETLTGLGTVTTGSLTSGATVGYEYRETNTDQPRLTTTRLSWGTF